MFAFAIAAKNIRVALAALAAGACLTTAIPAVAQDGSEARIRKLEAEVRALQRRVFPGPDGRFFEPVVETGDSARQGVNSVRASTSAVTDILARLDALETQIAGLTAQTEENTNALALLSARVEGLAPKPAPSPRAEETSEVPQPVAEAKPAAPSPERVARVQAIAKPQTGDAADDEYSYGFRLWNARFYPEARQQLQMFVERYSNHWRVTYGRNLLGRAYLDDGKPREAASWFLNNYQSDKTAPRAGDSLLFLAEAMVAVEDTRRACIALAEFGETYPALATGRLQKQYETNRGKVNCN